MSSFRGSLGPREPVRFGQSPLAEMDGDRPIAQMDCWPQSSGANTVATTTSTSPEPTTMSRGRTASVLARIFHRAEREPRVLVKKHAHVGLRNLFTKHVLGDKRVRASVQRFSLQLSECGDNVHYATPLAIPALARQPPERRRRRGVEPPLVNLQPINTGSVCPAPVRPESYHSTHRAVMPPDQALEAADSPSDQFLGEEKLIELGYGPSPRRMSSVMPSIEGSLEQRPNISAATAKPDISKTPSKRMREIQAAEKQIDEINTRLQEEIRALDEMLHNEVSQRVIAMDKLQGLRKRHVAMTKTLDILWKLVQQDRPEFQNKSVQDMADRLCTYTRLPPQISDHPGGGVEPDTCEKIAKLERENARLNASIKHYERLEAHLRGKAERLVAANRQLKARMSLNEVDRQQLQLRLIAAGLSVDLTERPVSSNLSFKE